MPLYILAALVLIGLDQAVKYWALTSLQAQHTIPLVENVFHLTYVENAARRSACLRSLIRGGFL